jgi:preprotein translocase subunit Sec63
METNLNMMVAQVLLSYYDILGLSREADEKEIRRAHRKKAEIYHPDKVFHLGTRERKAAEMEMKLINNARDILLDPEQRSLYDQYLDGALEADEVLEAFIVVDELAEEERSPLWKKAMNSFSERWERRIKKFKERTGMAKEEVLEVEEVIEVEPIEVDRSPKKKDLDVIVVEAIQEEKGNPKKKKGKPFEVVGVVEDRSDDEIDEDFVE